MTSSSAIFTAYLKYDEYTDTKSESSRTSQGGNSSLAATTAASSQFTVPQKALMLVEAAVLEISGSKRVPADYDWGNRMRQKSLPPSTGNHWLAVTIASSASITSHAQPKRNGFAFAFRIPL